MSESRKVFIFNGEGTGPNSTADLNELFSTSGKIFPVRPDVSATHFNFNMDGLSDPVFVVPGGSTSVIGRNLRPAMDKIKNNFGKKFSYVGICAGAYLGTADAELFYTTHKLDKEKQQFEPAFFIWSTAQAKAAFNLIDDYKAYGAFYPDNSHLYSLPKDLMPYQVTISLTENNLDLHQFYQSGCLFLPAENHQAPTSEIAAVYANAHQYRFFSKKNLPLPAKPPAIIRQLPTENTGGTFLAGPHIETTCVDNSRLLNLFKESSPKNAALPSTQYNLLVNEKNKAKPYIESLLQETLRKI
jgi:glutamine amidotransferase-like uncharacterized protein